MGELLLAGEFTVEFEAVIVGRIDHVKVNIACNKLLESCLILFFLHLAFADGFALDAHVELLLLEVIALLVFSQLVGVFGLD